MELKEYLTLSGISNADFATQIGVSIFALRKYLRKERMPRPVTLARIRKVTKGAVSGDSWLDGLGALDTKTPRHHNRSG